VIVVGAVLAIVFAGGVAWRRRSNDTKKQSQRALETEGIVLSRTNTMDMVNNPLRAGRGTSGLSVGAGGSVLDVNVRGPGGARASAGEPQHAVVADPDHDYVEPNAGQPAVYDMTRSHLRSTPSYANPSFACATAVPNPSRDVADHSPAEEGAYDAVVDMSIAAPTSAATLATAARATVAPAAVAPAETHYKVLCSLYGGGGASTTTTYPLYQVLATPNTQQAKDDQGYALQPNHAIVSQASAGHIYAIPMAVDDSNV